MNSVKIKWTGNGIAPKAVKGAGFSTKPYEVKAGVAEVDSRDLYTILNRNPGDWSEVEVKPNVSSKSVAVENEQAETGDQ